MRGHRSGAGRALRRLALAALLSAAASPAGLTAQTEDPWEEANRRSFAFNDFFDRLVVRPVASTYNLFVPRFIRQGIANFFSNINDVNVLFNNLMQLKIEEALSDSGRILINSTVGLGGVLDIASDVGLRKNEEDFGQTLGAWGVGSGPYVVLPMFGASNLRDSFGLVLDTLFNPIQYQNDEELRYGLYMLQEVDTRSSLLSLEELVTGDRYLFFREAYIQRREYLVNDGRSEEEFGEF